jgi:hypothetical protein
VSSVVSELFQQLQQVGGLVGIPLLLAGIMLAGVGWRIWKVAVVLNFALIGGILGNNISPWEEQRWLFALACGVIVGCASFPIANYAVSALGGLVGAGITFTMATAATTNDMLIWVVAGIALLVCCGLSFLYLRQVIILVTSFEGGVLLLAAAVAIFAEMPGLFGFFRRIAVESAIFVPFLLLVPTVIGSLLQMAEVNRRGSGVGQG